MAWEYSEKTKQLFMDAVHGKPGTHLGEIEDPDGVGEHGSIACGDSMRFTFRVKRDKDDATRDIITAAKYLTFGCTSAIAASEALCSMIEERQYTPIDALQLQNKDIVDFLGGLPEQKVHCSVMGAEALESAVFNWAQRRGVNLKELGIDVHEGEEEEGRIVCKCFSMSEPYLRRKIQELNLRTIPEITNAVKAGGACMTCHDVPGGLQDLLDDVWRGEQKSLPLLPQLPTERISAPLESSQQAKPPGMSPYQFSKKVERVMDEYIRPLIQRDGGNAEIVDIKESIVYVQLGGTCAGCAGSDQTIKLIVEKTLKDRVHESVRVIQL